jgi:flagellar biosynthesis/type III secretory pathway chaperone
MDKGAMLDSDISKEEKAKKDLDFDELLDALLSVLRKEVEVYEELQAIIAEEHDVLIRPSSRLLFESNAKKETCVLKAKMSEEVRANIVKKIAKLLDREEKEINFTILSSCADESRKTELDARRKILFPLVQSINKENEKNKNLLDYSLSYIRSSINFINDLLSSGIGYVHTGKLKIGNTNGRILNREG